MDAYAIMSRAAPSAPPEAWTAAVRWTERGGTLAGWLERYGVDRYVKADDRGRMLAAGEALIKERPGW